MWVSIFIARDEAQCDEIMNKLDSAGIMNRVRPGADKKKGRQTSIYLPTVMLQQVLGLSSKLLEDFNADGYGHYCSNDAQRIRCRGRNH